MLKKTDLSNESCNVEEPKNIRKSSLNDSDVSLDFFTKILKSPECLYTVNCMKNIKAKIKEICEMNQVTQDNQTGGECHLRYLVKPIEFYNGKIEKLERYKKERRENQWTGRKDMKPE